MAASQWNSFEGKSSSPGRSTHDTVVGDAEPMAGVEDNKAVAPVAQLSTLRSVVLVLTCTLGMMVNTANAASVSIALPTIGKKLNIEEAQLQWVLSAYSLSSGCLLLFFGRLADLYGRKKAFLAGAVCSTVFGIGCGFANDQITIDVLRGIQGLGGAATIPASLGILAHAFPPSRARSLAFATFSAGAPVGAALGMIIGGVLTQETKPTWRSLFFLVSGLSLVSCIGGLISIDSDKSNPTVEVDRRVDWIGAFLVTTGLVLIVFVLSDGEVAPNGWKTPYIIALLILGVILVVAFLFWQGHLERAQRSADPDAPMSAWTPPPLMKLSLWSRAGGKLSVMMWVAFLNWACFISWNFWAQLYYQDYEQLSPILTMVRFTPMFVVGVLCNVCVALLVGRIDVVFLILIGTAFTSCATLFFALIHTSAPYWAFGFPSAVLSVFGADFVFAAGTLFVAKVALPEEQSLAGALFQTMTQIGTAFGLTISTIVFNRVSARNGGDRAAQLHGYRSAQWASFAFGALAFTLTAVFLRGVGVVGHTEPANLVGGDAEQTLTLPRQVSSAPADRDQAAPKA